MAALSRRQESLIKSLATRHGRRKSGLCVCEGLRCCRELLKLRPDLVELAVLREGFSGQLPPLPVEAVELSSEDFAGIATTQNSQGVLMLAARPEPPPDEAPMRDAFAFVLDQVSDPGNMGTIMRTAMAAGLKELWLTKGAADPFSEKVIRAAMGAQFALALRRFDSLKALCETLRAQGVGRIYRTVPSGGESLFSASCLFERTALVMGSEAWGASDLEGALPLSIPMPGAAESLNVAQAATIILFEHVRRSGQG